MAPVPAVVLLRRDVYPTNELMRHEAIHHVQQREMLVVLFWIIYGLEFLIRWAVMQNWQRAYRRISFEKEASDEGMVQYRAVMRRSRPFWNWVNYL